MGKRKYNIKGRQVVETLIDEGETKKIKLDSTINDTFEYGGYDKSNPLVLPSKKRTTKIKAEKVNITRILSKKKRKTLEKIVDKKKKKESRVSLLDKLATVQLPINELKQYTSIINVQTKGIKKKLKKESFGRQKKLQMLEKHQKKFSSIAGGAKKKRMALLKGYIEPDDELDENSDSNKNRNLNHIGIESNSSDDESYIDNNDNNSNNTSETNHIEQIISDKLIDNDNNIEVKCQKGMNNIDSSDTATENKETLIVENNTTDNTKQTDNLKKPTVYIHVERNADIQAARLKLPISNEEQIIMETINDNQIIIIAGETGSGKTTQVPQFLYEAGYAEKKMIGITEPRRVAAISMSNRVATEMNLNKNIISYLIRFEGNVTEHTKIKFMTDGVLLKEIESDFILSKYAVIILDEAHERSIYTDILIGLLSRIVPLRNKRGDSLKLIIMSATLRIEDFTNNRKLFKTIPPVLKVETRQFPVTIHFNRRTTSDYVKEAFNKAIKIHSKLPEGGILIFLTGQQEVNYVVRKLRKSFPSKNNYANKKQINDTQSLSSNEMLKNVDDKDNLRQDADDDDDGDNDIDLDLKKMIKIVKGKKHSAVKSLPVINLDNYSLPMDDAESDLFDDTKLRDNDDDNDDDSNSDLDSDNDDCLKFKSLKTQQPLWVLPLYSLLSSEKQARVFQTPPNGTRLCVVSTNVAETSITIPNIKYIVDCGRQKTRLYDKVTGVTSFVVTYTSKASANQRAGRAGRTSAGHCYRLYSSAVYNNEFVDFAQPDIQKKPVADLMLQMKCMGIDKVINFPFPSPPDRIQLEIAEKKLKLLGALEDYQITKTNNSSAEKSVISKVTGLGHAISAFPVSPKFGKMLALSHQHNLLPYTVCMVAALSVQEILIETKMCDNYNSNDDDDDNDGKDKDGSNKKKNKKNRKWLKLREGWAKIGNTLLLGDPAVLLRAVGAAEYAHTKDILPEFCQENGLRLKAINEIRKLRCQITNEINLNIPNINLYVDPEMKPPSDLQAKLLRQILLAGMCDQVAKKIVINELKDTAERIRLKFAYQCADMEEPIFMHSTSVLRRQKQLPEWVIYQEIYEIQNGDSRKMFMRGITAIEPEWLLIYAQKLCNVRQIKEEPQPKYNEKDGKIYAYVDATYGRSGWEIPLSEIEMPANELTSRYFTMYLLDGSICPNLSKYKKFYRSDTKNIIKSWSRNIPHILNMVNKINKREINSKQKLLDIWKIDSNFLLQEFCDFVDKVNSNEIAKIWPPI